MWMHEPFACLSNTLIYLNKGLCIIVIVSQKKWSENKILEANVYRRTDFDICIYHLYRKKATVFKYKKNEESKSEPAKGKFFIHK